MPNFLTFVGLNLPQNVNIMETGVLMLKEISSVQQLYLVSSSLGEFLLLEGQFN